MVHHTSRYDLVVFGATGFVGRILCQYLLEQVGVNGSVKWAIAGRSQAKLNALVSDLGASTLPQIVADVSDEASLQNLCDQTQVVISTVGPYALYGEPLVKVCAETGTDYCDLTGEPQWIRQMIQRYSATAERSGARIVHCCGFDSIPSDLGVYYLQQQAKSGWEGFAIASKCALWLPKVVSQEALLPAALTWQKRLASILPCVRNWITPIPFAPIVASCRSIPRSWFRYSTIKTFKVGCPPL